MKGRKRRCGEVKERERRTGEEKQGFRWGENLVVCRKTGSVGALSD